MLSPIYPTITQPTPSNNCAGINGDVEFTCSACTDTDKKTLDGITTYPADTVTYTWTADGGSFPNGNIGPQVTWTAPPTPGTYTVTVTVDDVDSRAPPGGGSDDDSPKQANLIMHVEAFAQVWSTCTRSSPDGSRYSGTGCTIGGSWVAGAGRHLTKVELWVNGICRYRYTWSGSEGPEAFSMSVPFSSTQFEHNSEMTLKARCWNDHCANPGTGYEYKIAWNRGYVLYNQYIVNGLVMPPLVYGKAPADQACNSLQYMNHYAPGPIHDEGAVQMITNIRYYGVFYMYGHSVGSSGLGFWDGIIKPGDPPDPVHAVFTGDVAMAIGAKAQNECPYVFVFLDSCYNGQSGVWREAFGAQAMLGWTGIAVGNETYSNWTKDFWDCLRVSGATVATAREWAHFGVPAGQSVTGDTCWGNSNLCLHKTYQSL